MNVTKNGRCQEQKNWKEVNLKEKYRWEKQHEEPEIKEDELSHVCGKDYSYDSDECGQEQG